MKHTKVNEFNLNGDKLTKTSEIAEGFNEYFVNIGPKLAENMEPVDCHFHEFIKQTKSEFAAFDAVSVIKY